MSLILKDLQLLIELGLVTPTRQSSDGVTKEYRLNYISIPLLRNLEDNEKRVAEAATPSDNVKIPGR